MRYLIVCLLICAGSARGDCPPPEDFSAELDALAEQARAAPNAAAGREISDRMWQIWLTAPDASAQAALDKGMRRRESYDFLGAIEAFNRLVAYCEEYAEGYNQRAFINFQRGEYEAALVDLDAALARQPRHLGAQSGRALTLLALGRVDAARAQLQSALALNPWLSERALLAPGGPLAPKEKGI